LSAPKRASLAVNFAERSEVNQQVGKTDVRGFWSAVVATSLLWPDLSEQILDT